MNPIKLREYKRQVFNHCLLECITRFHASALEFNPYGDTHEKYLTEMANKMCRVYFTEELALNTNTIDQTKGRLSEAVTFMQDCLKICEAIAEDKAATAAENDVEVDPQQDIELSPEDEELLDQVFEQKNPEVQLDQVRDATVKALAEEDKKAQEIRDSLSIAQSQVAAGGDPAAMEETVNRLNQRGPTSLMNAILNALSSAAIKDVNESSTKPVSAGAVMRENAKEIRDRACMIYMMYETANVLGIHHWDRKQVQELAEKIYYGK